MTSQFAGGHTTQFSRSGQDYFQMKQAEEPQETAMIPAAGDHIYVHRSVSYAHHGKSSIGIFHSATVKYCATIF